MNWHAIFVIAALAVCGGLVLYMPFFIWFRWRNARRNGRSTTSTQITRAGFFLCAAMLIVLFSGLAVGQISPQSWFGAQVRTLFGGLGFATVVCAMTSVVERLLVKRGFVFLYRSGAQQPQAADVDRPAANDPKQA
jgi:hypothetical protein